MKYSKGITWINDCRIPFKDDSEKEEVCKSDKTKGNAENVWLFTQSQYKRTGGNPEGRFPPNLLVCDDALNDGTVSKGKVGMTQQSSPKNLYNGFKSKGNTKINDGKSDKGSNSRYYDLDLWFNELINKL